MIGVSRVLAPRRIRCHAGRSGTRSGGRYRRRLNAPPGGGAGRALPRSAPVSRAAGCPRCTAAATCASTVRWHQDDRRRARRRPRVRRRSSARPGRRPGSRTPAWSPSTTRARRRRPGVFLVMELVQGGTLRDVLRGGCALHPAAPRGHGAGAGRAGRRDRAGLVHRDVKPENVLVPRRPVKVADFGLAGGGRTPATSHAGVMLGTVAYLAPEQVTGGRADARSDVYAAGIVLFELLTGVPPYGGDDAVAVACRHVHHDVPPPSAVVGGVPPALDAAGAPGDPARPGRPPRRRRRAPRRGPPGRAAARRRRRAHYPVPPPRPGRRRAGAPCRGPAPGRGGTIGGRHAAAAAGRPGGTRTMTRPPETAYRTSTGEVPAHLHLRRRSRRIFGVFVAIVTVLALLVAATAWWLGSGRWTAMPALVGMEQATAQQLLGECRSRRQHRHGLRRRAAGGAGRRDRPAVSSPPAAGQHGHARRVHRASDRAGHRAGHRPTAAAEAAVRGGRAGAGAQHGRRRVQRRCAAGRGDPHPAASRRGAGGRRSGHVGGEQGRGAATRAGAGPVRARRGVRRGRGRPPRRRAGRRGAARLRRPAAASGATTAP